jgi:hypothetical protein
LLTCLGTAMANNVTGIVTLVVFLIHLLIYTTLLTSSQYMYLASCIRTDMSHLFETLRFLQRSYFRIVPVFPLKIGSISHAVGQAALKVKTVMTLDTHNAIRRVVEFGKLVKVKLTMV